MKTTRGQRNCRRSSRKCSSQGWCRPPPRSAGSCFSPWSKVLETDNHQEPVLWFFLLSRSCSVQQIWHLTCFPPRSYIFTRFPPWLLGKLQASRWAQRAEASVPMRPPGGMSVKVRDTTWSRLNCSWLLSSKRLQNVVGESLEFWVRKIIELTKWALLNRFKPMVGNMWIMI